MASIASELFDQMSASQENTSITLTYILWHRSQLPDLKTTLRNEVRTLSPCLNFSPSESATTDGGRNGKLPTLPAPQTIDSLRWLHAIIYESLRLHPVTPGPQPWLVPKGGSGGERMVTLRGARR